VPKVPIAVTADMDSNVKDAVTAINRVEDWKGKEVTYKRVAEGITNPTWELWVDGKHHFFMKVPGKGTEKFINRDIVYKADTAAGKVGSGPAPLYYFPDTKICVYEWLEGYYTCRWAEAFDQEIFFAMIDAMKKFHNCGADLGLKSNAFDHAWQMIKIAEEGGGIQPYDLDGAKILLERIEKAFKQAGMEYKPCHSDTYIINFMWNPATKDCKMIDFEYASMGDITYDLGIFSVDEFYEDPQDMLIIKRYFGEFDEQWFARLKLMKLVSDIKWGMWASVQALEAEIEFDFVRYNGWKFARYRSHLVDPRVEYWLNILKGKPVFQKLPPGYGRMLYWKQWQKQGKV
jgi:thiamine kinase-like enzyme